MKPLLAQICRAAVAAGIMSVWALAAQAQSAQAPSAELRALLAKHYGGYAAGSDPAAVFAQTTEPDWANCGANGAACQTRDELAGALSNGLHKLVPDMKWQILDEMVSGDQVIVRGQGTGTPVGAFLGVPASGKSFHVMSIDIHTINNGRIAHTYHLEDWAAALSQLSAK